MLPGLALRRGPFRTVVAAASLPAHRPSRILIVSDTVNPHNLSSADLTEGLNPGPGDIGNTLRRIGTGIALDAGPGAVREIPTNDIEQATSALSLPACDPSAVDAFLGSGGGMISFHHGSYASTGKNGILDVVGATARAERCLGTRSTGRT